MKHLFIVFAATIILAACSPGNDAAHDDLVVLTVTGTIAESNRAGRDAFTDPLFTLRQIEFDSAYTFSFGDLNAMPQHTVTAAYASWDGHTVTATGPRLLDVLVMVGATGSSVTLQAIDGYTYEIDRASITGDYVLAVQADGEALHLGGHGPIWLVIPEDQSPAGPDSDEALVWGVYVITVAE